MSAWAVGYHSFWSALAAVPRPTRLYHNASADSVVIEIRCEWNPVRCKWNPVIIGIRCQSPAHSTIHRNPVVPQPIQSHPSACPAPPTVRGPSTVVIPGHRIQPEPPTRSQASSNLNFKFTCHASENSSHPILPGHSWPPSLSSPHGHPLAWPSSPSGVIRRPCPHRRGSAAHPHSSSRAIEYDLSIRLGVRLEFQVHLSSIRFAGPLYPPFQRYAVVIKIQSMGRAIRHSGCSLIVAT